jgi:hypothetical protein
MQKLVSGAGLAAQACPVCKKAWTDAEELEAAVRWWELENEAIADALSTLSREHNESPAQWEKRQAAIKALVAAFRSEEGAALDAVLAAFGRKEDV